MRRVAPEATTLRNRFVLEFSLYRLWMTFFAQRPGCACTQVGAILTAVGTVTFSTCFLRHGLVNIGTGLELVTEKTEAAPLAHQLKGVLRSVLIAVAS